MPSAVNASHHNDLSIRQDVDQAVREAAKPCAAIIPENRLILIGILLYRNQRRIHGMDKLGT
jgi:hypothetical protein